jgi:hypothetical protein
VVVEVSSVEGPVETTLRWLDAQYVEPLSLGGGGGGG